MSLAGKTILFAWAVWLLFFIANGTQAGIKEQGQSRARPVEEILVAAPRHSYSEPDSFSVTKTHTDLLRIPQSVIVLNQQLLNSQGNQTLSEALVNVSAASVVNFSESLLSSYRLRGFEAVIYHDGLPAYTGTAQTSPASLINIERIDIVKGPVGTLYGGGTGAGIGGMINLVTKTPGFDSSYTLGLRTGSFSTYNPYLDINQPLTDRVAMRVTTAYEQAESHLDSVEHTAWSINPSLLFQPAADTRLILKAQYDKRSYLEYAGLPVVGSIEPAAYRIAAGRFSGAKDVPYTRIKTTLLTAKLSQQFSEFLSATVAVRFYDSDSKEYNAFPYEPLTHAIASINNLLLLTPPWDAATDPSYAVTDGFLPTETRQYNLNANLLYQWQRGAIAHQLLLGFEADQTENNAALFFNTFCEVTQAGLALLANPFNRAEQARWLEVTATVPYLDLSAANSDVPFGKRSNQACFGEQHYRYSTTGIYLQDQISIGSQFTIDLGLRWTDLITEERQSRARQTVYPLTGRFGITYALSDAVSLFTGYSEGFEAPRTIVTQSGSVEPVYSQAWEVGAKWRTAQGLTGSLAWFDSEKTNVATADPANPGFSAQVGEQTSQGIELDWHWPLTERLYLLGNYAHIHAEVSKDNRLPIGDTLPRVPKDSGRISMRYEFAGIWQGASAQLGASYRSSQQITLPNQYQVESYTVLDAQLAYQWQDHRLQLSVQNLTDRNYFLANAFLGLNRVEQGRARAVYLTLEAAY